MSKLAQVRKALQENHDIVLVGALEENDLPDGAWGLTVDFYTAPKKGIYTVEALQKLMMSLIPDVDPSQKDNFRGDEEAMSFGKLYFDEDIGRVTTHREYTLTEEGLLSPKEFVDGKLIIDETEPLQRRVWVRLFPDAAIAAAALKGENTYSIRMHELTKYRGIVYRLASLFT